MDYSEAIAAEDKRSLDIIDGWCVDGEGWTWAQYSRSDGHVLHVRRLTKRGPVLSAKVRTFITTSHPVDSSYNTYSEWRPITCREGQLAMEAVEAELDRRWAERTF